MKELLHEEDIKEEALAQGREERSKATAINLYKMGMPMAQIAQAVEEKAQTIECWVDEFRKENEDSVIEQKYKCSGRTKALQGGTYEGSIVSGWYGNPHF